jgi:hypothetical protein
MPFAANDASSLFMDLKLNTNKTIEVTRANNKGTAWRISL